MIHAGFYAGPVSGMAVHIAAALKAAASISDRTNPTAMLWRQDVVHRHNIALLHAAKAEIRHPGDIARADATIANLEQQLLAGGLNA